MQAKNIKHIDSETKLKIRSYIRYKRYSKVIEIIESLNNPNVYLTNSRTTALMMASQTASTPECLQFIRYLLNNGADINAKNSYGKTALVYAIQHKKIELIRYLINSGANLTCFGKNGFTLLDFANLTNNTDVINTIQKALTNI